MHHTCADHVHAGAGVVNVQSGTGSVELQRYPASHPFAQLQGSDNIIAFTTARYRCLSWSSALCSACDLVNKPPMLRRCHCDRGRML